MSLEEALRENTETVREHNDLLKQVLTAAGKNTAAAKKSPDAEDGEKPTRRPRATKAAGDDGDKTEKAAPAKKGPTAEDLANAVKDWIDEIEVEVDDDNEPVDEENAKKLKKRRARTAFIKKCLAKVGAAKVGEIDDAADVKKVSTWFEAKKAGEDPFEGDED